MLPPLFIDLKPSKNLSYAFELKLSLHVWDSSPPDLPNFLLHVFHFKIAYNLFIFLSVFNFKMIYYVKTHCLQVLLKFIFFEIYANLYFLRYYTLFTKIIYIFKVFHFSCFYSIFIIKKNHYY